MQKIGYLSSRNCIYFTPFSMKKNLHLLFSILMLWVIVANTIWELRLQKQTYPKEWMDKSEEENESKSETEKESEKDTEEKDPKKESEEDKFIFKNQQLSLQWLNSESKSATRLAHRYSVNLPQVIIALETPPPEVVLA
jgi:phosphatidate phosphatase PAH1